LCTRVSSDASRNSYAADLGAKRDPNLDASGEDTTFCPTRTQHRARHKSRRAARVRTIDSVRTTTRKHWSLAEQIRCRAPRPEPREAFSYERMYARPRRGIPARTKNPLKPASDAAREIIDGHRCRRSERSPATQYQPD